jgi:hypothetical protein
MSDALATGALSRRGPAREKPESQTCTPTVGQRMLCGRDLRRREASRGTRKPSADAQQAACARRLALRSATHGEPDEKAFHRLFQATVGLQ